ncbi:MAG: 7-cyano-7-deazaguanine synthase QueC [Thermoplasmatales archaeon]|nr:7-cyano-7-deazaguanine synthase QueC [Thermoplasmatales archaeon]
MSGAVVLLSGGLDSTVTLAFAVRDRGDVVALSFRYGQKHTRELGSAAAVAAHYGVRHVVVDVDLSSFSSSLIGEDGEVPSDRPLEEIGKGIPSTYVPARNIIMLSVALGLCESVGADTIYIGANTVDYSGYPDCTGAFFRAFEAMAAAGTKTGVEGNPIKIATPIQDMSKADIVKAGKAMGAPLGLTWSCYGGGEKACGRCDSCRLRLKGFADAGYEDEIPYEAV